MDRLPVEQADPEMWFR